MPTPLSRDPRRAARERSTTSTESDPRAPSSTKGLEPTTPPDSTTASKTKVRQRPPRRPQTHFPPPRASAPAIPRLNQRAVSTSGRSEGSEAALLAQRTGPAVRVVQHEVRRQGQRSCQPTENGRLQPAEPA